MSVRTSHTVQPDLRGSALAGVLAPVVFALGVVVASLTWPGYDHRVQNLSDLGGTEAPYAILQNATFVLVGLLVGAFSLALRRSVAGLRAARTIATLVGYFGSTLVVQGLTPCTPRCQGGTAVDLVHVVAALTGLLAIAVATLLVWRRLRSEPGWRTSAAFSAWTGSASLVFLAAWLTAGSIDPDRFHAGIHQRLAVTVILIWVAATGSRLARRARGRTRPDELGGQP